ncbi:nucleotidyltransferase domain-containing protein [Gemmiger formicilis]|uniref:nucleotidyltransferase domain-containing protein n=1 Tax=Gemmiger formicilis TaxID=745368 RepID=UPI003A4D91A5
MEKIIEYIEQKYNPLSIILYGSYANGTNNRYKKTRIWICHILKLNTNRHSCCSAASPRLV